MSNIINQFLKLELCDPDFPLEIRTTKVNPCRVQKKIKLYLLLFYLFIVHSWSSTFCKYIF